MEKTTLLDNLQYLQDLKFEIFIHSTLNYRQIKIEKIELPDQSIDLIHYVHKYRETKSIAELANLIKEKYNLQKWLFSR